MKTKETKRATASANGFQNLKSFKAIFPVVLMAVLMLFGSLPASAHCDSYDGPAIKDAMKALETGNVNLILKWITPEQEKEIIPLFNL